MCSITLSKVETAFRMFDTDQDGFLSWEEFQQVRKKLTKNKNWGEKEKLVQKTRHANTRITT